MPDHNEREPLLAHQQFEHPVPRRTVYTVFGLSYALIFCSQLYAMAFNTLYAQALEGILCRDTYPDVTDPLADKRCKGDAVQSQLSVLTSMEASFEMLPPLILGIVYGLIADVYGRKPIMVLATLGACLYCLADMAILYFHDTIPIKLFWAVPALYIFTGGAMVAGTTSITMITDVVTKGERSAAFLIYSSGATLGGFLSAPLAAALAKYGEMPSLMMLFSIQLFGLILSFFLPETLHIKGKPHDVVEQSGPITKKLSDKIGELRSKSLSSLKEMFWGSNVKLTLLLMSSLFTGIGRDVVGAVRKQYAVRRYGLEWTEAGLVLSISAFMQLILSLIIMPLLLTHLRRCKVLPVTQDAYVSRVSALFLVAGSILCGAAATVEGFTTSVVIGALGSCIDPAVRSLLVSMAHEAGTGSVISAMEVLIALGIAISGPIVAATFRKGMNLGGGWLGLPMYTGAALIVPGAIILWCLRYDEEVVEEIEEERENLL